MAEIQKSIDLNVAQGNGNITIIAKQNDTSSRYLQVQLMNESEPIFVDKDSSVTINAKRSDEESKMFAGWVNDDGTVRVPLTQWILGVPGSVSCSVTVVDSQERMLSTTSFNVSVEQQECLSGEISEDENYDLLVTLLAEVAEVKTKTEEATENAVTATIEAQTATKEANAAVVDYEASKAEIEAAVANIKDVNVTADAAAEKAVAAKNSAVAAAALAEAAEDNISETTNDLMAQIAAKGDNLYFNDEDGKLYLMSDGEIIGDGVTVATSGGDSGSGNNAVLSVSNTTGWLSKTIAEGANCVLSFTWSSLENDLATGDGVLTVKVGTTVKATQNIAQGDVSVSVTNYLSAGSNTVKLSVTDVYGNTRTINFSITVASISVSSTFDSSVAYSGDIAYTYIPKGNLSKTVYFLLDGAEIGTATVLTSGRQQSFTIPAQSHGSHTFEVYFTAEIDGQTVESNHLYYDLICVEDGNTTPIIASAYNTTEVRQYETINISYIVYNPQTLSANVVLAADGETVASLTVSRTEQTWAYRADSAGSVTLTITCGSVVKTIPLTVTATDIDATAETEDLELYLSSYGRSNNEADPASWVYGDIACTFEGYNWVSNGWISDDDGITVHRVSGGATLTVPLQIFATDFRTTGKTIELEFATRDVLDYDGVILSCYSGSKGLLLTAQKAVLKSEQSKISTQYKEDEHIRLAFVVEKRAENRLIYIYLNGIMCGAAQYPESDDFSQTSPVNITIGSESCTIDLYAIRVYNNDLTRYQILENWIADTQDIEEKLDRYNRNLVYDDYGSIVYENLPNDLPYLIIEAETLPQYKGNKVTVSGKYVDPTDETKSFTFTEAQADVQGTSSAGYARKNYKIKFKNGFVVNGQTTTTYKLRDSSIATDTFTFKADVASSEGANNVELVRLYNDACTYQTPPQKVSSSIRQGIDGKPIVIFHNNGTTVNFVGKYNFNNDKGTPEVFGFADGDESWEILNNTSDRVLFKSADFSTDDWENDFEARYPEDNEDTAQLSDLVAWVASTDTTAATGNDLPDAVTYGDTTYTIDSADYRLAKFKAEFENYVELDSAIFYYLFTELFLMVDSRAKNAFPSKFGSDKFCFLPYDMDTALGINNEGSLVFGYDLEDIDTVSGGADVFNGQQSVLWKNLRDAFGDEIKTTYQELRSGGKITYELVESAFEKHQSAWSEAIWNEDAYYKYLQPLVESGTDIYLPMLQGSKSEQRKWWLYNRFRYIDSKYNAGDSLADYITLRGYAVGSITVEPYADIYASVKYGSYLVQKRALRGESYTLDCPLDTLNDTEIYVYSSSQLKSVGDLSPLKAGLADFSMATKLQALKLGDSSSAYENGNLTSLTLGNNTLLKTLDVRNCTALGTGEQQSVDLSGCTAIEEVYFDGTAIKGVTLPNGGNVKVLHLPNTITNLTLCNLTALADLTVMGYSNLTTLRLENIGEVANSLSILKNMAANSRVRLIGINWTFESLDAAKETYDLLDTMRGLDENGNNTDGAQVSGTIYIPTLTSLEYDALKARYPSVEITYGEMQMVYTVSFLNEDGTPLYTELVKDGDSAYDPVTNGNIETPVKEESNGTRYKYAGWDNLPSNVTSDVTVVATYTESYAVYFYNGDELLSTAWVDKGGTAVYSGDTPTKDYDEDPDLNYQFTGWSNTDGGEAVSDILMNITAPKSVYAVFILKGISTYGVSWTNDTTTTMERTDDAVGMTYAINSSTGTIASDFDDVFPWSEAKVETDDNGNVMLHMPAMWFRITTDDDGNICGVAVSSKQGSGDNWYYVNEFYYGCYGASGGSSGLKSVSGVSRLANTTRANFRTYAKATGDGYQQLDLYHKTVMMFLWWIEWATKDSASIMSGRISGSGTSGGSTVCACGGTDSVTTPSGFNPATAQMRYHYIEDFVGNLLEWIDGIVNYGTTVYVTNNSAQFGDTSSYGEASNLSNPTAQGCALAFGWDSEHPFLSIVTKTTGSTSSFTTGFCDGSYLYTGDGSSYPCVSSGAYYYHSNAVSGLSYFNRNSASYTYANIGGRLLKTTS